jgi:hypothetical protein
MHGEQKTRNSSSLLYLGIFSEQGLLLGAKGVVCGTEGVCLADNRVPIKLRKCHLFLPIPIYACQRHGP